MLDNLKLLLGLEGNDLDDKLTLILDSVKARLKLLLKGEEPPEEMNHIILDVAVIRYNRIGSEGMSVNSVEGQSQQYNALDFAGYMDEINAFLDKKDESRGKVKFI